MFCILFRLDNTAEEKVSLHCTESGLVNTFQMLTYLFPEVVAKTEVIPLAQVGPANI